MLFSRFIVVCTTLLMRLKLKWDMNIWLLPWIIGCGWNNQRWAEPYSYWSRVQLHPDTQDYSSLRLWHHLGWTGTPFYFLSCFDPFLCWFINSTLYFDSHSQIHFVWKKKFNVFLLFEEMFKKLDWLAFHTESSIAYQQSNHPRYRTLRKWPSKHVYRTFPISF